METKEDHFKTQFIDRNKDSTEIYNFTLNFIDKNEKSLHVSMSEEDDFPLLYENIRKMLKHRKNFYIKLSFKTFNGEEKILDEINQDTDGYISGVFFEHKNYVITKDKNPNAKEYKLDLTVSLHSQKRINLQIFSIKFTELHCLRVKTFFDDYIPRHKVKTPFHKVDFWINYQTIEKEEDDFLVIFCDENFIDQIIESEFEKADRIMFWSETSKAKELMSKYPNKIYACNNIIDFLLTPRFFDF